MLSHTSCERQVQRPIQKNAHIASIAKDAITYFFAQTQLEIPASLTRNVQLEKRVQEAFREWGLEEEIRPHDFYGIFAVETAFRHYSDLETSVHVAIYTALMVALDGICMSHKPLFETFHRDFCARVPRPDTGLFGRFSENVKGMWEFFPPFAANAMVASTLQFINGCILETTPNITLSKNARPFVEYRRELAGNSQMFAMLIWEKSRFPDISVYVQAIPDIVLYLNYVNDIFSFYKEETEGEENNYLGSRAITSNKPIADVLRETVCDTVLAVQRIRSILGQGEARDVWESFASGYVQYHVMNPRYHLRDIIDFTRYTELPAARY